MSETQHSRSKKKILLHGTLSATIFEIRTIPRSLNGFCDLIGCFKLYVSIDLDKARVGRTVLVGNKEHKPQWNESFLIYCAHEVFDVIFTVKINNPVSATLIGRAYLPAEEISQGSEVDKWLDIWDQNNEIVKGNPKIHVKLRFTGVEKEVDWSKGIATSPTLGQVPWTFFPERRSCRVSLYQDAHIPNEFSDQCYAMGRKNHVPRCWEDIFDAITDAKYLIYITGWSVYTKISLVRDPNRPKRGGHVTLGELLKNKAEEDVKVLMLVWDDRTSVETLKQDGLMDTHDEETRKYFKRTKVHCHLCPRNPHDSSVIQGIQVSTMFTHHQKTVVVDSEILGRDKRRIVSFVGGIDLCDGRYDTPHHPLFKTTEEIIREEKIGAVDFHQPNFTGSSYKKGGPREPWHDIHCRLEGPAAWDVLYNFEQRWRKQVGWMHLYTLEELDQIFTPPTPILAPEDPETWNVQIFRSIDSGSVDWFALHPKPIHRFTRMPEEVAKRGLTSGKNRVFDKSIQNAYIKAIRRAKNFIYIENQYFLGSSYGWNSKDIKDEEINALQLIPKELSLKICGKIRAGERFSVYVVIPMWPEGIPESQSVQAILDWQRRTIEMMYIDVTKAIKDKGASADPREYLTFFCLGNRELEMEGEYKPPEKPESDTDYSRAQVSRRFMIYVHSKMMAVDDEYIIVGSANINQRSMDGERDTEIAMGGYQPNHLSGAGPPRGEIFWFRLALWYEHLGLMEENLLRPESEYCIRRVNKIAEDNWKAYAREKFDNDLIGHLLRYPIEVSPETGLIIGSPGGTETFPDTNAKILGAKSEFLPPILTT